MEVEMEARVKPLPYKVKAMSRESPAQKASHVLDSDLRNHWSTATNTKEWILLELDVPCLLSHIRIYNKSVLEWELSVGLRYKPETFVKVRTRCEAPRRDMIYPMNYTACRYVRISCLRGNPIAIFFVQLIGVSVAGLEPEFQPVVNHLLPHIISHKQDAHDMHLQLLQDMTNRLVAFLPQLEADLNSFSDAAEPNIRFLAMLAGPFYPILYILKERSAGSMSDLEASRNSQSSSLTVSSNFEPRRPRNTPSSLPTSSSLVFRPDAIFVLLKKAYKDSHLGIICKMVSRVLMSLVEPTSVQEASITSSDMTSPVSDEASKSEPSNPLYLVDYSNLFGEEFLIPDDHWDSNYINLVDIGAEQEGILHVLFACASQPLQCSKLAESTSDFWSALPLVQALLPALRPNVSSPDQVDDNFSQWKQPIVQHALSQIVAASTSSVYRPLLRACAGYLSSYSPSHAKASCVLIDLCSGVLAPWIPQVIAKVDLTVELLEDLIGVIQGARHSFARARAALKYIVLALSGHMDDMMAKYKDVKHRILFLVEMLEPFLDPSITPFKSTIAFGNVSSGFLEKQEHTCAIALNLIRMAVRKPAVLPSLESEWRRGSVAPSVLLSILEPRMQLPPAIDLCKFSVSESSEQQPAFPLSLDRRYGGASSKFSSQDDDGKTDASDANTKSDVLEDASLLFAPPELRSMTLASVSGSPDTQSSDLSHINVNSRDENMKNFSNQFQNGVLENGPTNYCNLHADYLQLMKHQDCELKASEFRRLASDLHSQADITLEGHNAAIDALLLAAESYVNPFFMTSFKDSPKPINIGRTNHNASFADIRRLLEKSNSDLEMVAHLESKRDKVVLEILLEAAEMDRKYRQKVSDGENSGSGTKGNEVVIDLSKHDLMSTDAITLVRQNQALLFTFLVNHLRRDQQSIHEILLQSFVFLLQSATKLCCSPEDLVDIILESAEYLYGLLTSFYYQFKEGNLQLDLAKVHEVQRRWMLLQRLVIASSGANEGPELSLNISNGFRFANLIPPSAWIQKIPTFSSSASPLVRFLGWMAVSRNAKKYQNDRLFLASDLSQLMYLLSIFADELAQVNNIIERKDEEKKFEKSGVKQDMSYDKGFELLHQQNGNQSFHAMYPEISQFFPNMMKRFESFGENILEAVGLQLRSLSSSVVPDLLCWFSDLCSWPFLHKGVDQLSSLSTSASLKGFVAKSAKVIVLYVLEAIIIEHMEAMVPEIPRVVQVLVSLCRTSYCDVSFLDSVLHLLKPIISYSLRKVLHEERLLVDDSCLNFESLCFDELFNDIGKTDESRGNQEGKVYNRALSIFILASVFPDLSFQRKRDFLESLIFWADFASFEPTASLHDYLCAFQAVMESCKVLLLETLRIWGFGSLKMPLGSNMSSCLPFDDSSAFHSWFLRDVYNSNGATEKSEKLEVENGDAVVLNQKIAHLSIKEVGELSKNLESLISKLSLTVELCWKIHLQLAKKLTLISAECFMYSRCLSSIAENNSVPAETEKDNNLPSKLVDQFPVHWSTSLEELAELIIMLQENHCWEVASIMLDCLLGVPECFSLDNVIGTVCSAIKTFSCNAPKIAWRLQTDKWLSFLYLRGIHNLQESINPLVNLLNSMLGHAEPEQRYIGLQHLGKLVGQDSDDETSTFSLKTINKLTSPNSISSISDAILATLVTSTWDQVVVLALSDMSLLLRTRAMALLVEYIPLSERRQLQSILAAADTVLHGITKPTCEGLLSQLSLVLIATVCLYTPAEDIFLIPENVWRNIEALGKEEMGRRPEDLAKKACQALCRVRNEGEEAKEILKEVLSSSSSEQVDPDFGSTRESILQVLANLTSVKTYFDLFAKKCDERDMELDEAEMEMEILQREQALEASSNDFKDWHELPFLASQAKDDKRLEQIKDGIRSIEKAKLREEIIAHRQKKQLVRCSRKKYLEEAAVREAELLQELDRERTSEVEKEIERQRLLEQERARTRELRHALDVEKEKQTQRELQRELEQVESGLRLSRRDFSSTTHSSRPRERYRERENGRPINEGSLRTSSVGLQNEATAPSPSVTATPTVVLSGSRSFSGQTPMILQSRERADECGSSYEENFDGSRDSGDTGSVGDPDLVSALEGQSGGFGSAHRHGSRGSKSRQVVERRERDGRREGKWERKH